MSPPINEKEKPKKKKKSHGNRKLQRFRQRRRARGMSEATIAARIESHKNTIEKPQNRLTTSVTVNNPTAEPITSINKRKRDISSLDLLHRHASRSSVAKKVKHTTFAQSIPLNSISANKNYPMPAYLTRSTHLIFQMLRREFNRSLNRKDEQIFIHLRLQLFDLQFRLELDQRLWQSYLDLGLQQESIWPRSLYEMAKTNQSELIENYIMTQLAMIDDQIEQCIMELSRQAQSESPIPILLPSLEIMDIELKKYVRVQQHHLLKRMDDQLNRCKNDIRDQHLHRQLFTYPLLTNSQRTTLEQ
ncbi:unnamed protein product, partial [Rotaria magnacalcarata]